MSLVADIALLALGLGLLIGGADALVRGAAELATRLGISTFVVGLTVVAFGTSLPELAAGVRAAWQDRGELAVGAVVGSNIANVAMILAVTALISPVRVRSATVRREAPIMFAVSVVGALVLLGGAVTRLEGAALFAGLLLFVWLTWWSARGKEDPAEAADWVEEKPPGLGRMMKLGAGVAISVAIAAGLLLLAVGAELVVLGSERVARAAGVSEAVIGISMVAVGTSLPELATCAMAALRKHSEIVVGNILGSNIFNVLCVLGIASLVRPLRTTDELMWRDGPWMAAIGLACLPIMASRLMIGRVEAGFLLIAYAVYLWLVWSG